MASSTSRSTPPPEKRSPRDTDRRPHWDEQGSERETLRRAPIDISDRPDWAGTGTQ